MEGPDDPRQSSADVSCAYRADRVWSLLGAGDQPMEDAVVIVRNGVIERIVASPEVDADIEVVDFGAIDLAPGFVDVQVNGGGGVLLNDDPTPKAARAIAEAHRRYGTTSLLPTLITDSADKIVAARKAIDDCLREGTPGVVGVHFEGPFLDERKSGAHDRRFLRDAKPDEVDSMLGRAGGVTLVTAAANRLGGGVLERWLEAGVIVSLGHSAATFEEATDVFEHGVRGVTHLYNAMSPLESRAPGVVGATFAHDRVFAGLILDGIHAHYGAARAAFAALGRDRMMLVTDAVQPVGAENCDEFRLGGQTVRLENGRCVNDEGNLAGSALDMQSAVRNAVRELGVGLGDALVMASRTPARFLGLQAQIGGLGEGMRADMVALDHDLRLVEVIQGGDRIKR